MHEDAASQNEVKSLGTQQPTAGCASTQLQAATRAWAAFAAGLPLCCCPQSAQPLPGGRRPPCGVWTLRLATASGSVSWTGPASPSWTAGAPGSSGEPCVSLSIHVGSRWPVGGDAGSCKAAGCPCQHCAREFAVHRYGQSLPVGLDAEQLQVCWTALPCHYCTRHVARSQPQGCPM